MGYHQADLRQRVLSYYLGEDVSQIEACEIFGVSVSSFKRWYSRYRQGECLEPIAEGKGRPCKIDEQGERLIKALVVKNPSITLAELSEIYYKKTQVIAGRSVLSRVLQKLNLRYKKLSIHATEKDNPDVKKKR